MRSKLDGMIGGILEELTEEEMVLYIMGCRDSDLLFGIYATFGRDGFIKFVDIFSGQRIEVPTRRNLKNNIFLIKIFSKIRDSGYTLDIESIAEKCGVDSKKLARAIDKYKNLHQEMEYNKNNEEVVGSNE